MVNEDLAGYYDFVRKAGKLRTIEHARRWSDGVLKTLGINLDGRTKRVLAKSLPGELARPLKGVFWLLHFRDPNMTQEEFQQRAARRSGNSNAEFAVNPILAVFAAIRQYTDTDVEQRVARSLSPELSELWRSAER